MSGTDHLTQTVERFCALINALPANALVDQAWGPKEVLAHLVYHHELYVTELEAFVAGTQFVTPKGRFRDLNEAAVEASRVIPAPVLVDRFQKANQRLVDFYRGHDPNYITIVIKAGSKQRTLAALVTEVEAHIRNHLARLCKEYKGWG